MRLKLTFFALLFFSALHFSFSQEKEIRGTVKDSDGPLPGVSVVIKNTTKGVNTDFNGAFQIKAKRGDILIFSFVGMKTQEIKVTEKSNYLVFLKEDAQELEAVIVTANYGGKNKDITSSGSAIVSAETMAKLSPTVSVDNMLQGKAVGVDVTARNGAPGQTATIRIRGAVSLNTKGGDKSAPLYVVDGVFISEDDLAILNPSDIESISVLKDAQSTAIYGSRGANGVVLITTKQGKKGKAKISYSGRLGLSKRTPYPYELMNAEEKIAYEEAVDPQTYARTDEEKAKLIALNHNWEDDIFQNGVQSSHNLSFSGAGDNGTYFLSAGYDKNTGIVKNIAGFQRVTARANFTTKLRDNLRAGINSSVSHTEDQRVRDRNNAQNPFSAAVTYNPYESVYELDKNGQVIKDKEGNPVYNTTHVGFSILEGIIEAPSSTKVNHFVASAFAEYDILEGLSFQTRYSANYRISSSESYTRPGSVLDGYVGDPKAPGSKSDSGSQRFSYTWLNQLNYTKSFEKHNLNATLFSEYSDNNYFRYSLSSKGYSSKLLSTQDNGSEPTDADTSKSQSAIFSVAALSEYDYDGTYFASATIRRDGASRFGVNNRYGTFWSLALGWALHKESFLSSVDWISKLKLNASYGTIGNWNIPNYAAQGYYTSSSYNGISGAIPRKNISNKNLSWETQESLNFGLESAFLEDKITFTASYFRNERKNFLFETPLSWEGGSYSRYENAGNMITRGWEFALNTDILKTKDWKWNIGANITLVKYKIGKLNGQEQITVSGISILKEGETPFTFFLPRYAGVNPDNGDALYFDKQGKQINEFSSGNAVVLSGKSPLAKSYGGLHTSLNFRGIDLSADFTFKLGNYIYNYIAQDLLSDGANVGDNQRKDALNYWKKKGDNQLPRLDKSFNQISDRFLQDGSYLRLRSLSLGYTIPKTWIKNSTVKLFVSADNLWTLTNFEGDPEVSIGSGESQLGASQNFVPGLYSLHSYPTLRTITFGLNINF